MAGCTASFIAVALVARAGSMQGHSQHSRDNRSPHLPHFLPSALLLEPKARALIWRGDCVMGGALWWGTVWLGALQWGTVYLGGSVKWWRDSDARRVFCHGGTLMRWEAVMRSGPLMYRGSDVMGETLMWRGFHSLSWILLSLQILMTNYSTQSRTFCHWPICAKHWKALFFKFG